jgi:hypothetical protein
MTSSHALGRRQFETSYVEEVQARPEPRKPGEARRFKLFGALGRRLGRKLASTGLPLCACLDLNVVFNITPRVPCPSPP